MKNLKLPFQRVFVRVRQSLFIRNVSIAATGTLAAQLIAMAFAPAITRVYGPEAFGQIGVFSSIVAVATSLAALAYPIAIVMPKEDRDARGLVELSMLISLIFAVLFGLVVWLVRDWLIIALSSQSVSYVLLAFPLAVLFSAWLQVAQHWLIRKGEFSLIARVTVVQSLVLNFVKIVVGGFSSTGSMLIWISTAGIALNAAMLRSRYSRCFYSGDKLATKQRFIYLRNLAARYKDFPLYRGPQDLINTASQSLPVLVLATFFSPTAAGSYTLAILVLGMPSGLIGKAVNDVFYPKINAAALNGERITRQIIQATFLLLAIAIIPFGLIVFFGPPLFRTLFGAEWVTTGEYARWLAVFYLFNFINKPCVATVPVIGLQRGLLTYEVFSSGLKVAALILGFYSLQSDILAIAIFSVFGAIAYFFMMGWIIFKSSRWTLNEQTSR